MDFFYLHILLYAIAFVRILNEMRLGKLSNEAIQTFRSLSRKPEGDNDIEPTELYVFFFFLAVKLHEFQLTHLFFNRYPLRNEVDESNKRRLDALQGETVEFKSIDSGDPKKMQSCLAPQIIQLKLHAQVMLLKNLDADLVNGSLGVVVGFVGRGQYTRKKKCENLRIPQRVRDSYLDDKNELDMKTPWPIIKFAGDRTHVMERESWSIELPGKVKYISRKESSLRFLIIHFSIRWKGGSFKKANTFNVGLGNFYS